MLRREFLGRAIAAFAFVADKPTNGTKLAEAARKQVGVTTGYDPKYTRIPYPNGDVPRSTGVCCDVIVRAGRDALSLDLQKLVHEDMGKDFAAYPKTWSMQNPDANIDHRRVPNLEIFWRRNGCELWHSSGTTAGNGFPVKLAVGDILTWRLNARWPHVGIVVGESPFSTRIVHNWGNGAEESALLTFAPHRAIGHFRWPTSG
ncbi:MAG: DUF1287 domain-containing protein [Acidobacteriota bacterium]|nr:DUF1287 domain-containing protein [Acidobacteriota bacterium]